MALPKSDAFVTDRVPLHALIRRTISFLSSWIFILGGVIATVPWDPGRDGPYNARFTMAICSAAMSMLL